MNIIGEKVSHKTFGIGKITEQNNKYITVVFNEEVGIKNFIYPDAFDKHIEFLDDDAKAFVKIDLDIMKEKIRQEEEKEKEKRENEEKIRLALKAASEKSTKKKTTTKKDTKSK